MCEEFEFLMWDYLMICNGIDLIIFGDIGKLVVLLLINKNLLVGILLFEIIFVVEM